MIPVIINNRDLLTWTKNMLDKIKTLDGVGDIFIIDNASTYQPLLDWYETNPCEIIRVDNLGHTAPWLCGLVDKIGTPYVITDPDLNIDDLPLDTLNFLLDKLQSNPLLGKVGLKLNSEIVSSESPLYDHLQTYEKPRWEKSEVTDNIYTGVHIDTTFALYNVNHYFVGGGSIIEPYVARHLPWEFTEETRSLDKEFLYYIEHASKVSSYKNYLKL
jgi:hypothetical protein